MPEISDYLPSVQQQQLAQLIHQVQSGGFGRLEIRIEQHQARWFRPASMIHNPGSTNIVILPAQSLEVLLGPWLEPFLREMTIIAGHGWGSLAICIEYGHISAIESTHDVRAHTGKTGPLRAGL